MSVEEKLKQYILNRYKSIREFSLKNNIAYSTIDSILKRGIMGGSVSTVIEICKCLSIDIDELACGNIVNKETIKRSDITRREKEIISAYRTNQDVKTGIDVVMKLDKKEKASEAPMFECASEVVFSKVSKSTD